MSLKLSDYAVIVAVIVGVIVGIVAVTAVVAFPGSVTVDSLDTSDAQVAALALQIKEMERSEDRLLLVVMSMIGIAFGGFAVAAVSFTRMHDRDVDVIAGNVETNLKNSYDKRLYDASLEVLTLEHRLNMLEIRQGGFNITLLMDRGFKAANEQQWVSALASFTMAFELADEMENGNPSDFIILSMIESTLNSIIRDQSEIDLAQFAYLNQRFEAAADAPRWSKFQDKLTSLSNLVESLGDEPVG